MEAIEVLEMTMSKILASLAVLGALIAFSLPASASAASRPDGVRAAQADQHEFSSRRHYRRHYRPYRYYRPYYRPYPYYGYYRPFYRPYPYYRPYGFGFYW